MSKLLRNFSNFSGGKMPPTPPLVSRLAQSVSELSSKLSPKPKRLGSGGPEGVK